MGAAVLVMFQFLETEGDQESTVVVEVVNLDWDSDSDQRIRSCQSAGVSISHFISHSCVYVCALVTRSCPTFCDLMDCSLCPWNSLDKNTEVGCHFLLQGISATQGSNPSLPR